jgi:parvulin-like peptidyl-prolyl isomerase
MNTVDTVIASLDGTRLSLAGLLRWLRARGRLGPLVREALAAQLVQEQARQAGLSATAEELQTADAFRRRHGLNAAADTRAWLAAGGMSVEDFEAGLEEDLLAAKFRQHVTADQVDRHWQEHQAGYERLRLALVMVGREELARELASQIREDGRELAEVVQVHGLPLNRGERFRKELGGQLAEELAAAPVGELVGPVSTALGFTLVVVEERRPAELDEATRRYIQNELFDGWLAERLRGTTFTAEAAEASG